MTNDTLWRQIGAYLANAADAVAELEVGLWDPELQDFSVELETLRDKAEALAATISGVTI